MPFHVASAAQLDHDGRGSRGLAEESGVAGTVARAGQLQENFGTDGVDGFADTEDGSRVCDDLEIIVAVQMEVKVQ
jgi:hypothetical protein